MSINFQPKRATKERARLRMALVGTSGSGKTMSALLIAQNLVPGGKILVIDTERGSASKYANLCAFDVFELDSYSPANYAECLQAAVSFGYDVVILDSLSHAWNGKDGALEMVDKIGKRSQSSNNFGAWRDVTPQHNAMVDAILNAPFHVIATMRAKTEYAQEKDPKTGRTVIRKVGVQPIQRDGLEYEFDVIGDMTFENELIISKTRCPELSGLVIPRPGAQVAQMLKDWLSDGVAPVAEAGFIATSDEVDECNAARTEAVKLGFLTSKGKEPALAEYGDPAVTIYAKTKAYQRFITTQGPAHTIETDPYFMDGQEGVHEVEAAPKPSVQLVA